MADGWSALRRTPRPTGDRQTPETAPSADVSTTITPSSVSGDQPGVSEGVSGDLRASAIEAASERVHERWMATKRTQGRTSRLSETGEELMVPYGQLSEAAKDLDRGSVAATVDALLDTGWRPPLPDTLTPWDAYREAYNDFRRDVPSWKAHFTAHHMHALEAALRVYDPCTEHSDTQWGVLDQHGQVHSVGVENETQARSMRSMTPVRREVGPWVAVEPEGEKS